MYFLINYHCHFIAYVYMLFSIDICAIFPYMIQCNCKLHFSCPREYIGIVIRLIAPCGCVQLPQPQPFARTQPSLTLFATKSVTYPFAYTISTPLTNFLNFTYNTLPLPIKPLTFPLLTSPINFAEGNFGNRRF